MRDFLLHEFFLNSSINLKLFNQQYKFIHFDKKKGKC